MLAVTLSGSEGSLDSSVAEFTLSDVRFFAMLRMTEKAKCSLRMTGGIIG